MEFMLFTVTAIQLVSVYEWTSCRGFSMPILVEKYASYLQNQVTRKICLTSNSTVIKTPLF